MTAVSLNEVLPEAYSNGYALPGFVVLGWEDAVAFVQASEETGYPIVIQAGPGCREHTPISVLGKMFRELADNLSSDLSLREYDSSPTSIVELYLFFM